MRDKRRTPQHPRDHNLMRDDPGPFSIQARYITISPLAAVSETTLQENTIVKKKNSRQVQSCSNDNTRVRRLGHLGSPMPCPWSSFSDSGPALTCDSFLLLHTTATQAYAESRACLIKINICSLEPRERASGFSANESDPLAPFQQQ